MSSPVASLRILPTLCALFLAAGAPTALPATSFVGSSVSSALASSHVRGWVRTLGAGGDDIAHRVAVDASGNVYVVGEFTGTVDFDPDPVATDFHGSVAGADVFLVKLDASGTFRWARTWGGPGRDVPNGIGIDSAGNVYVSGPFQHTVDFDPDPAVTLSLSSNNVSGANNIFLSKLDPSGHLVWAKAWGPADAGGESYNLVVDAWDRIYVVGDFSGTTTNFNPWDPLHPDLHTVHYSGSGPRYFDAFLSSFGADGSFRWAKTWGGEGYDDGPGVAVDSLGNVYVAGMYASQNIDFDPDGGGALFPAHDSGIVVDVFVSKFDSTGDFQWVKTWGGPGTDDVAEVVGVDLAGNVYVAGRFASAGLDFDPGTGVDTHSTHGTSLDSFLSSFDTNGGFRWARTWGGAGWDGAGALVVDGADNVYVGGLTTGPATFDPGGALFGNVAGGQDAFLGSFDTTGALRWAKLWGGPGDDFTYHAAMDGATGAFYAVGGFQGTADFDPGDGSDDRPSNGALDVFVVQFVLPAPSPGGFHPLAPCRVLDTRHATGPDAAAPALVPAARRRFTITGGSCGVPADAVAVSTNVTVVNGGAAGDLRVLPGHLTSGITTTLGIPLGKARANNAILLLAADGGGTISVVDASTATVDFILDVSGYFR